MKKILILLLMSGVIVNLYGCNDSKNNTENSNLDNGKISEKKGENNQSNIRSLDEKLDNDKDENKGVTNLENNNNEMDVVKEGSTVLINYIGKLEDGTVFDTNYKNIAEENGIYLSTRGYNPLEFEVGKGMMIPGFEKGVIGMSKGEKKTINISPSEGYGESNEAYIKVVKEGEKLFQFLLLEVNNDQIKIDFNHFLAGKNLNFELEVVGSDGDESSILTGDTVSINYIGKLEDGTVFDTSYEEIAIENGLYIEGRDYKPLEFEVGGGMMIPGFERGVIGMGVGDKKSVEVTPNEGYGEKNSDLIKTFKLGDVINFQQNQARVTKIEGDEVTIDFNHFLAGKNLIFEVELVDFK